MNISTFAVQAKSASTKERKVEVMKKLFSKISLTMALIMLFSLCVSANSVSPALDIIAKSYGLTKASLVSRDVYFEASDFDGATGLKKVESLTIESLPEMKDGTLMLGNIALSVNQSISRKNFDNIRFVPRGTGTCEASFSFRADKGSTASYTCSIYMLENENLSPTAQSTNHMTYEGIPIYGRLSASDPENDVLVFNIAEGAQNGSVVINDKSIGSFKYSPDAKFVGSDSFVFEVCDKYGNASGECEVSIEVCEPDTNIVFSDLDGHYAHFAAIKSASEGIMSFYHDGTNYTFAPDEPMSRVEFCVSLLKSAGYTGLGTQSATGYADDSDIPTEYKGYVRAASILGVVRGITLDSGEVCFCPNNQITRAEAAVMINRLYGFDDSSVLAVSSFEDGESVPAWATSSLSALVNAKIINGDENGNIMPYSGLTRAEAALMLAGLIK